ncbi:poly(ethylene terephthalate) hydrolase family protein [Paenibacillus dakarensis]|uniref:poly(ethylene terephthalate) hydrolase family protein n=1 Tax=Paenibacillus dakarensis TaxID=1527293 RepID=UPI0006D56570|nr:lipase [Paenibacillus dakarensis]
MNTKIIVIVILCLAAALIGGCLWLSSRPAVPKTYTQTVQTGGEIEAKYLQNGAYEVSYKEASVLQPYKKYEIWYPSALETKNEKYPVVIFCNGTGVKASKYTMVLEHLASWGFIVMATEEEYSWNGFSAEMSLRFAMKMNGQAQLANWESNPFFGKVDLERIGVSGHSQGGVGAINAATDIKHASMIKAVFAASPTWPDLAAAIEWDYDASKLTVPTLLLAATGNTDSSTISPLNGLQKIYNSIPDSTAKLMFRRNDGDHGDMLYFVDGYMTAFFMWQLQDDEEAAQAFAGENAEILSNRYYQDIEKNR